MRAFTKHQGKVVTMDRADVDTDQIIPKDFLKRIQRTGFEDCLFYSWRFDDEGQPRSNFELNQPKAAGASVLVARRNFGCGSSREHAVWALENYGFRVVIAPSLADIFYNNCFKNGVLPVYLSEEQVEQIFVAASQNDDYALTVDLHEQTVSDGAGIEFSFEVEAARRDCLLQGLDEIAVTLQHEEKIAAFEASCD